MVVLALPHPEVLAAEWLPPVPLGRAREIDEVGRRLAERLGPRAGSPLAVVGPAGCGTSTTARLALRALARRPANGGALPPLVAQVRTRRTRGTASVAAALLQTFDPGFDPRGFSTREILAGFLRRVRRDRRPALLLLDDLDVAGPPLLPILRALEQPGTWLPEGAAGLPALGVVLAGRPEAVDRLAHGYRRGIDRIRLEAWDDRAIAGLVSDRIARALGREPPPGVAERVVEHARGLGRGAAGALDALRRELLGPAAQRPGSVYRPVGPGSRLLIERHLLEVLQRLRPGETIRYAELRDHERRQALAERSPPLPATTFWRRILRLEQEGYLRREIRLGGLGGTRSSVRLLTPVERLPADRPVPGTPRASAGSDVSPAGSAWGGARVPG